MISIQGRTHIINYYWKSLQSFESLIWLVVPLVNISRLIPAKTFHLPTLREDAHKAHLGHPNNHTSLSTQVLLQSWPTCALIHLHKWIRTLQQTQCHPEETTHLTPPPHPPQLHLLTEWTTPTPPMIGPSFTLVSTVQTMFLETIRKARPGKSLILPGTRGQWAPDGQASRWKSWEGIIGSHYRSTFDLDLIISAQE